MCTDLLLHAFHSKNHIRGSTLLTPSPPESDAGLFISTSFSGGKNNSIKRLNTVTQRSAAKFQLNRIFIRIDIVINSADFLCCEL
jgi:hypothetical protein